MKTAWSIFALSALAVVCSLAVTRSQTALPYYDAADFTPRWTKVAHHVGKFRLTTQTGADVTSADLAGRIHVASFIFTTCPTICPTLVQHLRRVQDAIAAAPDVLLVSYSVTPAIDTPARLAEFGRERGIDPSRWLLVTGDARQIADLSRASYFADDRRLDEKAGMLHTEKLLLVDREGHLRGVYNGTIPFEVSRLIEDVQALRRGPDTRHR